MKRFFVFRCSPSCVVVAALLASVEFIECPKCDRRMRISEDGRSATVNVSRLKDDAPDAATLERRKAEMSARAERYLALGRERATGDRRCPLMGWSSWNTFGLDISEEIILGTARAMATNGLKEAGYLYVNIDDGFFDGHDEGGRLRIHPRRFPKGLKGTVDGIHALGLRAGIYSDAGADTCGNIWAGDAQGKGAGLYGHDAADCRLHFNELGFDFIKVDYCGGQKLKLDERARYTEIAKAIAATGRTDVRLNLCRWAFPGTWAADIADSWRTTEDIRANWRSVRKLISENLYLSAYASPGHYNDLDMLEVGQLKGSLKSAFEKHGDTGLTADEETAHFGLWCMMSSPLLIGCDVRAVPSSTLKLVTNPYLIAMDQNRGLGLQGRVVRREGEAYVLVKDADRLFGTSRYVALYNGGDAEHEFCVKAEALELAGRIAAFDLVERADLGDFEGHVFVKVPAHGAKFFRMDGERRIERTAYEAEDAFLAAYQELKDAKEAGTAAPVQVASASGGVAVRYLGGRPGNDLLWRNVRILAGGRRTLEFLCSSPGEERSFFVEIDGKTVGELKTGTQRDVFGFVVLEVELAAGLHAIRLSNATAEMPDIDVMTIR